MSLEGNAKMKIAVVLQFVLYKCLKTKIILNRSEGSVMFGLGNFFCLSKFQVRLPNW